MKIELEDIKTSLIEKLQAQYLEYPKKTEPRFVMQRHWRGRSVHTDFRFEVNAYLVGWSFLDSPPVPHDVETKADAEKFDRTLKWKMNNEVGFRGQKLLAVTKARQPRVWLTIKGKVAQGQVGATKHETGYFLIHDKGWLEVGALKPFFKEYFLHGGKYTGRFLVRTVKLPLLDPKTKKPIPGKTTLTHQFWKPKDQEPYTVGTRARRKGWIPPSGIIPIPRDWIRKNKAKFEEWKAWAISKGWKPKAKETKSLAKKENVSPQYALMELAWGTGKGTRQLLHYAWQLQLQLGVKTAGFNFKEFPLEVEKTGAHSVGALGRPIGKEGSLSPKHKLNPTKTLEVALRKVASGRFSYSLFPEVNGRKKIGLNFLSGDLKGRWILFQDEKGSDLWTFSKASDKLALAEFVLQKHFLSKKDWHYDIRFKEPGKKDMDYFSIWTKILGKKSYRAQRKVCKDPSWFDLPKNARVKVGGKMTLVQRVDKGPGEIIEKTASFVSVIFKGEKLKGYYIFKKDPAGDWNFEKSKMGPEVLEARGHPETGPFKEPKYVGHANSFELAAYDVRWFTRSQTWEPADLPSGAWYNIASFPVEGELPDVYVRSVEFNKEKWDLEKAKVWFAQHRDFITKYKRKEKRIGTGELSKLMECPHVNSLLKDNIKRKAKSVTLEFERTFECLSKDDNVFRCIALAEGTWNGTFYPYEEIKLAYKNLLGKEMRIAHEPKISVGKVINVEPDDKNRWIWADFRLTNGGVAKEVKEKKVDGVSVQVEVDKIFTTRGMTATNMEFGELSLTSKPACVICKIKFN